MIINKLKIRIKKNCTLKSFNIVFELFLANLKTLEYNSILGLLWTLLNPIVTLAVLYAIFHGRIGQSIEAYPLYLILGIICINFFAAAITHMIKMYPLNRDIVVNSMVPRENLAVSILSAHGFRFLIELFLCWIISVLCGFLSWQHILIIPLFISFLMFTLGIALFLSLIYCYARDIDYLWLPVSRLLLFITPVFYQLKSLSLWARILVLCGNPITYFVLAFRSVIIGDINVVLYCGTVLLGLVFFITGYGIFISFENQAMERV